ELARPQRRECSRILMRQALDHLNLAGQHDEKTVSGAAFFDDDLAGRKRPPEGECFEVGKRLAIEPGEEWHSCQASRRGHFLWKPQSQRVTGNFQLIRVDASGCRAPEQGPVRHIKLATMTGAGECTALELALDERTAAMRADIVEPEVFPVQVCDA